MMEIIKGKIDFTSTGYLAPTQNYLLSIDVVNDSK